MPSIKKHVRKFSQLGWFAKYKEMPFDFRIFEALKREIQSKFKDQK